VPPEVAEAQKVPANVYGRYVALEQVGRGGLSQVHRAWDLELGRVVALKILERRHDTRDRFIEEAQIAASLEHPSICAVYGAGQRAGVFYLAMQFVDGEPIDRAHRPLPATLGLVRDVAVALQYAHDQDVVHRDVKPGNILVDRRGRAFLTDFGTAKEIHGDFGDEFTDFVLRGTPEFLSPEQARGAPSLDGRSDIYSLGATLYALLVGRPPFGGMRDPELLRAVVRDPVRPPRSFDPSLSLALEAVLLRALEKDPADRFQTADAFARVLDALIGR